MFDVFAKLLNMSLSASILVFAIILFRLIFKKSSKRIICFLWILVAIRLMCPVSIESHISVFNLLHSKQIGTEQAFQFQYSGHSEKPTIEFTVPALVNDDMSADSMTMGVKKPDFYGPTVVMIWMAGVVTMLAAALISYINLRKEVAASMQREKNVFVCDGLQSPFILGLFKPMIYLPSGMDESVVKSVLLHEKAHIKRRDHIWKPLGYLLLSVYWFNPVMWIAFILLCRDIEAACDEKVVSGMGKEDIAGYTEALLFCAVMRRKITACPVAFGETNVKGRVKTVLNYKKPSFLILSLSLVASLSLAEGFLTDPVSSQVDAAETEKKELYTDYIGDAPTVAAIAQSLPYPAGYTYSSIELQTEKEPYVLHIYLSGDGIFETDDFLKCADYAFDHIGNLSIILFLSEDSGEILAVHAEPEELLWEEETIDRTDSTWDMNASDGAVSIIGGADGPTSIFLAGKLGDGSGEENEEEYQAIVQPRDLYNYKTDGTADETDIAVNVANICFAASLNGYFPKADYSHTYEPTRDGGRLIMTFDDPLDASTDWKDNFSKVGNLFLALVEPLQEIRFEYQIEGKEDEPITLAWDVNTANDSLMEGDIKVYGGSKEKIAQLMEEMDYDPYQAEIIGMDRFGIRLSTKNVSPTGLTLVCVQDGTETTGQLQTGEKYKLVVQNDDTWEDVDYATDAIVWEEIALLIPNDGEVEWDIDWTRIYGELPEGKYCIVKEINDFRADGDYDTQVYSVAFEIGK